MSNLAPLFTNLLQWQDSAETGLAAGESIRFEIIENGFWEKIALADSLLDDDQFVVRDSTL
jgi:hypothetical protein